MASAKHVVRNAKAVRAKKVNLTDKQRFRKALWGRAKDHALNLAIGATATWATYRALNRIWPHKVYSSAGFNGFPGQQNESAYQRQERVRQDKADREMNDWFKAYHAGKNPAP